MGLGRHGGGVGAARWLASQGAVLTITDLAGETELADSLAAIADLPVDRLRLGQHVEDDFTSADIIVVNPAVPPNSRHLELARLAGAEIITEIELLLNHAPARVVGVTGSNGKTTTARMLQAILKRAGKRVWLGGNIGGSLLEALPQMRRDDWIVAELSSFQLHYLSDHARMPAVAVITNCTPNHLDWHDSYANYVEAKQRLLLGQTADSVAILNTFDPEVARWNRLVHGHHVPLYSDDKIPALQLQGEHNRRNAACAATAAASVGCPDSAIAEALAGFSGLEHRLQYLGALDARQFYNDSKATTPEAAVAALKAMQHPVWLLAGGYAKGGDYELLAREVARRCRGAALYGAAGPMLEQLVRGQQQGLPITSTDTLDEAFHWCCERAMPGEAIMLSPACASFDQYRDYAERGRHFMRLVAAYGEASGERSIACENELSAVSILPAGS
jgi:UDP-N-acetylmuramoylalanine--D-glutamate ligase